MTDSFGVLVTAGKMTPEQASAARGIAHGDILERANAVTGQPIGELFAAIVHGTNPQMRATADLISERTDPEAVNVLPRERAEALQCIPLRFEGATLVVAGTIESTSDALKRQTLSQLLGGQQISYLVCRQSELEAKIASSYRNEGEIGELAAAAADGTATTALDARARMVDLYISQAITDRASDIHFEPGPFEMAVRYRIDGVLVERPAIAPEMAAGVVSVIKMRAEIDTDKRVPHDGQIPFRQGARTVDIRVSTLPTIHGEKAVLRILDNSARLDLNSFGMNRQVTHRWTEGFTRPHGMLLVTGPTGSGKSTTLYATLAELATRERNVVTVEDPVEYQMPGINQVQIHAQVGLTFAGALRSILRQDPDVILVGEIRDLETAQVAIEAALTGHLVLSSLHTNSAAEAHVRLVEMGVEPFLVASVVECALAQRLVRRLCDSCREAVEPTPEELEQIGFEVPEGTPTTFFAANPEGCSRCSMGYRGRMALYEAAHRTEAMEQFIVNGPVSSPGAKAAAAADGMITLRQDGWLKVAQGLTTAAEILRVTV